MYFVAIKKGGEEGGGCCRDCGGGEGGEGGRVRLVGGVQIPCWGDIFEGGAGILS